MNPLQKLTECGQSVWLDYISRSFVQTGELAKMIEDDALRGVTSNPAIFDQAISESADYDEAIRAAAEEHTDPESIFQNLAVQDIQAAADVFRPTYEGTDGRDGFVSLEVSPHLARDTDASIAQGRELWQAVSRPNIFIKIPGTAEGLGAIRQLLAEGVNVNVTLLFGLGRYREVTDAFLAGMEERAKQNLPLDRVASVASFFLSRIDAHVDPMLERSEAKKARDLRGEIALASAREAYRIFLEVFSGSRFLELKKKGVRPQRLLWASTSTKNPDYPDTMYVEPLIAPDTINTMPLKTIEAYRDQGRPRARLSEDAGGAQEVLDQLRACGIDLDQVTGELEEEGIQKFIKPYDSMLQHLAEKIERVTS